MYLFNAALTVGNVIKAVQGINWKKLAKIFRIPNSECLKIFHEYSTVEEREVAVVRYWLLRDPLASWRRIIDQLYWHGEFIRAESLHYFAEELTGNKTIVVSQCHDRMILQLNLSCIQISV